MGPVEYQAESALRKGPARAPDLRLAEFETEALPHIQDLYRTAVRLLHDAGKAGDAVQETYLVAWTSFGRYQAGTNCRAWLFQILVNVIRHERRAWFKWVTGKAEDLAELELPASEPLPVTLTDKDILAALDKLPAEFREILLMVDVQEFTYKEAAEILRVPIGTVMSRVSRGRAHLRKQLGETAKSYGISKGRPASAG